MGLFASKVERVLNKCMQKSYVLHVRYLDGFKEHACRMLHMASNRFVIEGFSNEPREEMLMVFVRELKVSFKTRVGKVVTDAKGKTVFYCTLPQEIRGLIPTRRHYFIYPKGQALILPTARAKEALEMPVWDMASEGVALVNESGMDFKPGFRFCSCMIQIRRESSTVQLRVVYKTKRPQGNRQLEILGCKFLEPPSDLEELLATCRLLDAL